MDTHFYDLSARVLIYKEGNQFVAHALDFDIPAYGETEEKAKRELRSLLQNQITFASSAGNPDMIYFRAPKEFFDRWERSHEAALCGEAVTEKSLKLNGKALIFVITKQSLRRTNKQRFTRTRQLAVA